MMNYSPANHNDDHVMKKRFPPTNVHTLGSVVIFGGIEEGAVELEEGRSGDDVTVYHVSEEAHDVARRLPQTVPKRVLQTTRHQVHELRTKDVKE